MRTIEEVKDRCFVDDEGHWIFKGAASVGGSTRIYAPDYTADPETAPMKSQAGTRAVWHLVNQIPLKPRWRVFSTCQVKLCVAPHCIQAGPSGAVGRHIAKIGAYKGKVNRIVANRKIGRSRSKLTPELISQILQSRETGRATAARLGISDELASKVRRGNAKAFQAIGGMFTGLMSANATWSQRA